MEKRFGASIVVVLLFAAVVVPCVFYAQNAMGMNMVMPTDGMQQKCCVIQPTPNLHAALQSTVVPDGYRGILLLAALFVIVVLSRTFRIKTDGQGVSFVVRTLTLRQAKIPISGFERLLQRGIAQPRLYEPAIVLS